MNFRFCLWPFLFIIRSIWKILCCSVTCSRKEKKKNLTDEDIRKQHVSKITSFSVGKDACPSGAKGIIKNKETLTIEKNLATEHVTRNEELVVSVRNC
jgi:hypothetical protein